MNKLTKHEERKYERNEERTKEERERITKLMDYESIKYP